MHFIEKEVNENVKKRCTIISTLLGSAAVILAVLLVGVRLLGFQVYTVLSSSMEPTYRTGSLLYVKEVDPSTIEVGMPITFMLNSETVATHRVIEVLTDENDPTLHCFRTKGDHNEVADGGQVQEGHVLGVPQFSIPYLGYVAHFIQTPPGKYIVLAAGAAILLLAFLPDLVGAGKEKDAQRKETEKK